MADHPSGETIDLPGVREGVVLHSSQIMGELGALGLPENAQMLETVFRSYPRTGKQLPGELLRRGQILTQHALRHKPAERQGPELIAGSQALEDGARFRRHRCVGRLEAEHHEVQLLQFIGGFQTAGLLEARNGLAPVGQFFEGLRCQSVGRLLHPQGGPGEHMSLISNVGSTSAMRRRQSGARGERDRSASSVLTRQASRLRGFRCRAWRALTGALR